MILKYRAWNKKTQSFIDYGDLVLDLRSGKIYAGDIGLVESTIDVTDQIELMQSTGMKDKNGVEIFEGDLVEHDDNLNGDWETFEACEVVYDKDYAQFCFKWDAGNFLTDYRNLNVIGNIYENSELLEEQR